MQFELEKIVDKIRSADAMFYELESKLKKIEETTSQRFTVTCHAKFLDTLSHLN